MKIPALIPLLAVVAGCSTTATRNATLTPDQAGALAQQLANQKAQTLYDSQPFRKGVPARFVQGHWTWHALQAQGQGDMEATVEFAADGADPMVTVLRLENRPILP